MICNPLLSIVLALVLALASVHSALARAEARGAYDVMLCADGGMRIASIGADGQELVDHHACPDCCLGGWALEPAALWVAAPLGMFSANALALDQPRLVACQIGPRGARDPPAV